MRTVILVLALLMPTLAAADCPAVVTDAAKNAVPNATLLKCVAEKHGFEVKMQKADKAIVELDISAKGEIEAMEEVVPVSSIPAAVTKAFSAKYGAVKILKAEKETKADKSVFFELAWNTDKGLKEATFKADGTFVEEE